MGALHTPGYVPLQSVVYDFLVEQGDYSDENYFRWLQVAIRGFRNLNINTLNTFKVDYLSMDADTRSARLPSDYIDWIKVGILNNGRVEILNHNKSIFVDDAVPEVAPGEEQRFYYIPHYYNGQYITHLYGVMGGYAGSMFNINAERGLIRFSSRIPLSNVIIEYVSSGISADGATYIPVRASEALLEFLVWRKAKADAKATRGQVLDAKQDYLEQVEILEYYQDMPTYADIVNVFYASATQTPKR